MGFEAEVSEVIAAHRNALGGIWKAIRRVQRDSTLSQEERERYLADLLAPLSFKDVRQHFVMESIKHDVGVSFRSSMSGMMRVKRRLRDHGYNISPGANDKSRDLAFARRLGVPTPDTLQHDVPLQEVNVLPQTIVKPVEGANSRGVLYVNGKEEVQSVKSGRVYRSVFEAASDLGLFPGATRWISETAVVDVDGELARDFKVFMFYGVEGLFLEIDRTPDSTGRNRYAGYRVDGSRVDISPNHQPMPGGGVPIGVVERARKLSYNSPVPFLRVDFLVGKDGCLLGEVTPHPGNTYAGDLYEVIDVELGNLFLDAEARLLIDLLEGKKFTDYHECYATSELHKA